MYFIFIFIIFFATNLVASEMTLECENNYSYKIINKKDNKKIFFKHSTHNWAEIKTFKVSENKLELYIPNMKYLECSDKSLPVCKYSMRIRDFTGKRPIVTEVVLNDCYIGTMGCNAYEKGLELNKNFCKKK